MLTAHVVRGSETGLEAVNCLLGSQGSSRAHRRAYFMSSRLYERRFSPDDSGTLVRYLSR